MPKAASVFFAGPLPPPVHGFAVINAHMLRWLQSGARAVHVADLAPRGVGIPVLPWLSFAVALLRRPSGAKSSLYLPLSGGIRQLLDLAFAVPARMLGVPVFVHHHSFAYLNKRPWHARLALAVLRSATHIVLCPAMGRLLNDRYGVRTQNTRVLSNAAFLEEAPALPGSELPTPPTLVLGFLSNITEDKGIFTFFDTLAALERQGLAVAALIAGPVSTDITARFAVELDKHPRAQHLGAVYGEAKTSFFSHVHLLLFPTQYANEAEPVTLWEAMAHGVPVIALQRGCIAGMVPADAGAVVADVAAYPAAVAAFLADLLSAPGALQRHSTAARKAFLHGRAASQLALGNLLTEIAGGQQEANG